MKTVFASILKLGAAAALALSTSAAVAGNVNWSVTVGTPYAGAYVQPPPPAVVYVEPQPVYVRPRPVYVQPAPVVTYGQPYYYVESPRPRHWKHRHHHHHYHGHGGDHYGRHGRYGY